MRKISTKELLDLYFENVAKDAAKAVRHWIDRPELYQYEKKINKELVDMNVDEVFELLSILYKNRDRKRNTYSAVGSFFGNTSFVLRGIYDFYGINVGFVKNPLRDERMEGSEALATFANMVKKPFSKEALDNMIATLHNEYENEKAEYIELTLLLFYDGFKTSGEVALLQRDMIDFDTKSVKLKDRTVHLSDRCYELLMKFAYLKKCPSWDKRCVFVNWRGGIFKFVTWAGKEKEINYRTLKQMGANIQHIVAKNIDKDVRINTITLYHLGLYDYLTSRIDKRWLDAFINAQDNDKAKADEVFSVAKEYGATFNSKHTFRKAMLPFSEIPVEDIVSSKWKI